jgi:hypothetical protein
VPLLAYQSETSPIPRPDAVLVRIQYLRLSLSHDHDIGHACSDVSYVHSLGHLPRRSPSTGTLWPLSSAHRDAPVHVHNDVHATCEITFLRHFSYLCRSAHDLMYTFIMWRDNASAEPSVPSTTRRTRIFSGASSAAKVFPYSAQDWLVTYPAHVSTRWTPLPWGWHVPL